MENRTTKYVKYAFGEIVLVVVGILIALAINNWNQDRIERIKELSYLKNLREDVLQNKEQMIKDSTRFQKLLDSTKKGNELFLTQLNLKNFLKIYRLIDTKWSIQNINRSTYDEMLNNGSFYNIHNKDLREQIAQYYIQGKANADAFSEINSNGQDMKYNPDIFPIDLLVSELSKNNSRLDGINTAWMKDKNSKIYAGYFRMGKYFERANSVKIFLLSAFKRSSDSLLVSIDNELQQ